MVEEPLFEICKEDSRESMIEKLAKGILVANIKEATAELSAELSTRYDAELYDIIINLGAALKEHYEEYLWKSAMIKNLSE